MSANQTSDTSKELTDIEFEQITGIAFPGLALIFSLQSWFSEKTPHTWQVIYIAGLALGVGITFLLRRSSKPVFAHFPLIIYMILAPLTLHSPTMTPWMSLGLLTFAISCYLSAVFELKVLIPLLLLLTGIQIWLVLQDLPTFTDNRDMNLLHTYFSTTYTFGVGLAVYITRTRYVFATKAVDDKIEGALSSILAEMKRLSRINREDYRNLKLHGTTLNTLIYFKNAGNLRKSKGKLAETLNSEIFELTSLANNSHGSLKKDLEVALKRRTRNRLQIGSLLVEGEFESKRSHDAVLEIIREVVLNLEKHTLANWASISITIDDEDAFTIQISEDSPHDNLEVQLDSAVGSNSLRRILPLVNASLQVTHNKKGFGFTYTITGKSDQSRTNPEKVVLKLRNAALNQFAIDVIKIGIFFALVDLIGYVFLNMNQIIFCVIAITDALLFAYAFRYKDNKILFTVSSFMALTLFPIASINVTKYSQVSFFPTLFNLVLASAFLVVIEVQNKILRWIPLIVFSLEAVLIPKLLPLNSQDIFAGSTPAIPLITIFALSIIRIRQRVAKEDTEQIRRVFENQESIRGMEDWLDREYIDLLSDLKLFAEQILISKFSEKELDHLLNLRIQYIRTFLICSEHIESTLVRDLFERAKSRYHRGLETRISLNGENFFQYDEEFDFESEFAELAKHVGDMPLELTLVLTDKLNIELKFAKLLPQKKARLTKTIKSLDSKVNYLVSVG